MVQWGGFLLLATTSLLLPGSYVAFALTGELGVDYSNSSSTMLMDVRSRAWSARGCLTPSGEQREVVRTCLGKQPGHDELLRWTFSPPLETHVLKLQVELKDRLARCFFGEIFRCLLAEEEVERNAAAASSTATSGVGLGLCNARNIESC